VVAARLATSGRLAVIRGLGIDIVGIDRVRGIWRRHGERFLARAYGPGEAAHCLDTTDPSERLAARWAAKEAAVKALGTGLDGGITFNQIEVLSDPSGAPRLTLTGPALRRAQAIGATRWHCSLSHADGMAVAVVILED
jgi:holo-[acyl-carrier protein] synthase